MEAEGSGGSCPFPSAALLPLRIPLPVTLGCCFPPASPAPAPQDPLPPDSLCPGKIERADLVGRPPYPSPPRRVVLRGHCRGHAGRRVTLLSTREPLDGFLAGQKGRQHPSLSPASRSTHPHPLHLTAPWILQHPAQAHARLLLSQCWRLEIEEGILIYRKDFTC